MTAQHRAQRRVVKVNKRNRALRCSVRCVAVLAAFLVAYFLSEWLVTGAATLSIGRFLFLASDEVESL